VEIVGCWKRECLEKKMENVRPCGNRHMVLIVNAKLSVASEELILPGMTLVHVFFYSGREELKHVAERVVEELQRTVWPDALPGQSR
jgi:predicted nuclease of restriction endonuclease-like RecB superfamily